MAQPLQIVSSMVAITDLREFNTSAAIRNHRVCSSGLSVEALVIIVPQVAIERGTNLLGRLYGHAQVTALESKGLRIL